MPRITSMPRVAVPLTGLERLPAVQGGGSGAAVAMPLFTSGAPFGGAVLLVDAPMVADLSSTAAGDPGAGGVRFDNADPAAASEIFVSDLDTEAESLATAMAALQVDGVLYLQGSGGSAAHANLQRWRVTSKTDASGYTRLGVILEAEAGSFVHNDTLKLGLQQPVPPPGVDRSTTTPVVSGTTVTLDLSAGDYFTLTLAHNATVAFSNLPGSGKGFSVRLKVTQDGTGSRTLTQPASVKLVPGSDPAIQSAAGAVSLIHYTSDDNGTTVDATVKARGT